MHLYSIDGAAGRVGNDDTAWGYRHAKWAQVIAGVDPDPTNAEAISDWTKAYSDALNPYVLAGGYSNFAMDEPDRVHSMYGDNYNRLARIKTHYDPNNLFRVNQNIKPA
jgi:FAD/FMN-containing dehydrogenase